MPKRRITRSRIADFLAKLKELTESLPSESDQAMAKENIETLIHFLTRFRETFGNLPTREGTSLVRDSVDKLSEFVQSMANDVALSTVLGMRTTRVTRRSEATQGAVDSVRAVALLEALESLPVDEIRTRLETEEEYTVADLRAIAAQVGVRSTSRLSRVSLAHQIAMKIANLRGYRQLGGNAKPDESPTT